MNNEPEAPQWMKEMFSELSVMFEELFSDADRMDLEKMQRALDEQQIHAGDQSQTAAPRALISTAAADSLSNSTSLRRPSLGFLAISHLLSLVVD
jgi:hypothetical protein